MASASIELRAPRARTIEAHGPKVAILLYPGICPVEFGIVTELLGWTGSGRGNWYRLTRCSDGGQSVSSETGLTIQAEAGLEAVAAADIVVAPGWNVDVSPSPELLDALRRAHARGARLVGICTGAFLFGEAGLLKGRKVTTHWGRSDLFRRRFPGAALQDDLLYVDDHEILTSSGSAAGLDLLLHMVARDFGLEVANALAVQHTMAPHRAGDQRQKVRRPMPARDEGALARLLDDIRASLNERWTIRLMASRAHMSSRTLIRRFEETTGASPGEWVTLQRLLVARALLESSRHGMEDIAAIVGFGSAAALRHHFRRRFGVAPSGFRPRKRSVRARAPLEAPALRKAS